MYLHREYKKAAPLVCASIVKTFGDHSLFERQLFRDIFGALKEDIHLESSLECAVESGAIELVDYFLARRPTVTVDELFKSIEICCAKNYPDILEKLLVPHAAILTRRKKSMRNSLMIAVFFDNLECFRVISRYTEPLSHSKMREFTCPKIEKYLETI